MRIAVIGLTLLLAGCTIPYLQEDLNTLSPGMSRTDFLAKYASREGRGTTTSGALVRASKLVDGTRTDLVTLKLSPKNELYKSTEYWFVFVGDKLVQWGRPEDWPAASTKYQIEYNPPPGAKPPPQ